VRIVDYKQMLSPSIPVGTIFYRMGANGGCIDGLDGPYRKDCQPDDPLDLFYCEIGPRYCDAGYCKEHPFQHFSIDNGGTREGLFEHKAKYLVLSETDVEMLIYGLQGVLRDTVESICEIPDNLELP
jgi:hypothetical protein